MADPRNISYNKEEYQQEIRVYRLNNIGELKTETFKTNQIIFNEQIQELELVSDILSPNLAGTMNYNDVGNSFWNNQIADGRLYMSIELSKKEGFEKRYNFKHVFLITNIKLREKGFEATKYEISFVSTDWQIFNNYNLYSSFSYNKTYTAILNELFETNNLKVNTQSKHTDKSGFYISPANCSLIDDIYWVLGRCISDESGIYFVVYNHLETKYEIVLLDDLYSKVETRADNILSMSTNTNNFPQQRTINSIKEQKLNGLNTYYEISKPINFLDYNYLKRDWDTELYNHQRIRNVLPKMKNKNWEPQINTISDIVPRDIKRETKTVIRSGYPFDKTIKKLFLETDVLEGDAYGDLGRYASEIVTLLFKKDDDYFNKFVGNWIISRVFHTFRRGQYKNHLQLCRIERKV